MKTWEITWVLLDAQAACVFSCSASKRSSFFQSVKVIAAILRASVRRAISGFMPLARCKGQLRHEDFGTTMQLYAQSDMESMRDAQGKFLEQLWGDRMHLLTERVQ